MSCERANNLCDVRFVLGVAAGKGGVGKSTVSVNLARAAAEQGLRVGLLDADIYGPSMRHMLPEQEGPIQDGLDRIVPALSSGIKMISMAFFCESNAATVVRAPFANGVVGQFLHKVNWGVLDLLIIDFPPGTGDIHLTLAQESRLNGMVLVTTPQEIALLDVRKAVYMCHQMSIPILGVLENMSYWQDPISGKKLHLLGQGGGKKLSEDTGIPLLGEIPIDPLLSQASDKGENLFALAKESTASEVLQQACHKLLDHLMALEAMEGQYLKNFELVWP